ncbi:MAG: helix-turn-helix domain-containing protein [Gemmatimonadaceae bacterium]
MEPAAEPTFTRDVMVSPLTLGSDLAPRPGPGRAPPTVLWLRDQRGSDDLALTHEQIARRLGVSRRASVTEALRVLKANGLVTARRAGLHVVNAQALQGSGDRIAAYPLARGVARGEWGADIALPHSPRQPSLPA